MPDDAPFSSKDPVDIIRQLSRDLAKASTSLTQTEARYLVNTYYALQGYRLEAQSRVRALSANEEPHEVISFVYTEMERLEKQVKRSLATWADARTEGVWAQTIAGIGPVLSAGLMAHIDINKAPTVGHIWSFAGLNPTAKWEKGTKRPWNADLKVLCWKIGESFVKVSGRDHDVYGKLYLARKAHETARNLAGDYAEQAAAILVAKRIDKSTEAYKAYSQGRLPPGHLHARAKRYAVKLFLAHWHAVAHEVILGRPAPFPYVMEHMGHVHMMGPPNWPLPEPKGGRAPLHRSAKAATLTESTRRSERAQGA